MTVAYNGYDCYYKILNLSTYRRKIHFYFTIESRSKRLFTRIFRSAKMNGEKMQQLKTKTHLAHGIEKTEYEAQYDENVKALLSDKQVLARTLIEKYGL